MKLLGKSLVCQLLQTNVHMEKWGRILHVNKTYVKLASETRQTDGYYMFLMGYAWSPFRDYKSYLRIVVSLDEDHIQLILKYYKTEFITYVIPPGIYSNKGDSKNIYTMGDHGGALQIKYDVISKKTSFTLTRYGEAFRSLRFEKNPFSMFDEASY